MVRTGTKILEKVDKAKETPAAEAVAIAVIIAVTIAETTTGFRGTLI